MFTLPQIFAASEFFASARSRQALPISLESARQEAVGEVEWICAFAKERTGLAPPPILVGLS
jgi:hypothetical protein